MGVQGKKIGRVGGERETKRGTGRTYTPCGGDQRDKLTRRPKKATATIAGVVRGRSRPQSPVPYEAPTGDNNGPSTSDDGERAERRGETGPSGLAACEHTRRLLHLEHNDPRLLELVLDLLRHLRRRRDEPMIVVLDAVVRRMRPADEEDLVPSRKGSAARRADAKVALHADHDDLGGGRDDLAEVRANKRVVLALVDDVLAGEGRVDELEAAGARLVGLAGVAAVADVDDARRGDGGAGVGEDGLDVGADGGTRRDAGGGRGEHVVLDVEDHEYALWVVDKVMGDDGGGIRGSA